MWHPLGLQPHIRLATLAYADVFCRMLPYAGESLLIRWVFNPLEAKTYTWKVPFHMHDDFHTYSTIVHFTAEGFQVLSLLLSFLALLVQKYTY